MNTPSVFRKLAAIETCDMKEFEYGTEEFFYYQRFRQHKPSKRGGLAILKFILFLPFICIGYFIAVQIFPARRHDEMFWGVAVITAVVGYGLLKKLFRFLLGR